MSVLPSYVGLAEGERSRAQNSIVQRFAEETFRSGKLGTGRREISTVNAAVPDAAFTAKVGMP